jgi:phage shock protein A
MEDDERNAAVDEHLKALDEELARLRKMEAAMDRRIEEAEEEKRQIEEGPEASG